jgi:hypothetical protein
MKSRSQFETLLNELGRDPRLKRVIAKARRQTRGKGGAKVEAMTDIFLLIGEIYSHFATKKKARALEELMDIIYLLVQVSLLLKENIFDRREVKEFFRQSSKQVYSLAEECVAMILPKTKGLRPSTSRSA